MAVQTAVLLSATDLVTPSRTFRQALGGLLRPGAAPLGVAPGCVAGPAGSMGELTLVSDTVLRAAPFVAVVPGTHNTKQGQYLVPNDELVDLAVPGKDASQFRRVTVAVSVDDSVEAGVASSPTTDRARLHLVSGPLAASEPPLPAVPANTLLLGELLVPSASSGQPVTLTPYNPRTVARGGVLPVLAGSTAAPVYDGEPRWHPTLGLQIGQGGAWTWPNPSGAGSQGAIDGTAPPAGRPLLIKTYTGYIASSAFGDNTIFWPGGAFPNGLLSVHVDPIVVDPVVWHAWNPTRSSTNLRCLFEDGGIAAGLSVLTSVTAIGW